MSPTSTPDASNSTWINGAKPQYQSLRLTLKDGRAYLNAKGWSRNRNASDVVSLELDADGLKALVDAGLAAWAALVDPAPVAEPSSPAAA